MVLELKVPHGTDLAALGDLLPVLANYVLSFEKVMRSGGDEDLAWTGECGAPRRRVNAHAARLTADDLDDRRVTAALRTLSQRCRGVATLGRPCKSVATILTLRLRYGGARAPQTGPRLLDQLADALLGSACRTGFALSSRPPC
jgi:hypothetical protein